MHSQLIQKLQMISLKYPQNTLTTHSRFPHGTKHIYPKWPNYLLLDEHIRASVCIGVQTFSLVSKFGVQTSCWLVAYQ